MDLTQTDHLRAYGIVYHALKKGEKAEWLLNYRGGSFIIYDNNNFSANDCKILGVQFEYLSAAEISSIRDKLQKANMDAVHLEKAPKIAVYVPPTKDPWDDAVRMALEYANIPYDIVWDKEVLSGKLNKYDWLHLHHEDFTGQYGKFFYSYASTEWYKEEVRINEAMAKKMGFKKVSELKKAVALKIKEFVTNGGFLFAMCSATETIDIALASLSTDIVPSVYDNDPIDKNYIKQLNYSNTFAFYNFIPEVNPYEYRHSDIDVKEEVYKRGEDTYFHLFNFSAKYDPVPTMLVQDHTDLIPEFLGQTTGFHKRFVKPGITILAMVDNTDEVKYLHGEMGKGTFTFLAGHDPEDYKHYIGDPPTDLAKHKHSPGYRLILNNILFPAAKKKKLKT